MQKGPSNSHPLSSQSIPAFSPIVDPISSFVEDLPYPVNIPGGTLLIDQDQRAAFVGLIRGGVVKLTFSDDKGSEIILGLRSAGWWINANLALLDVPSLCSVHTVTECAVSKISAEDFSDKLCKTPALLKHYLFTQCRELLALQQYTILRGRSASERLKYMLNESDESVWETVDPTKVLRQSDVAELLGITPEHLSRVKGLYSR